MVKKFSVYRKDLYRKLHPLASGALEDAIRLAEIRGNPYVELAHWVFEFRSEDGNNNHRQFDFNMILARFGLDLRQLDADIAAKLGRLPTGASSEARVSFFLDEAITQAWPFTSILFNETKIRSGHLVFALLRRPELMTGLQELSSEFLKIKPEALAEEFAEISQGSQESLSAITTQPAAETAAPSPEAKGQQTTALGRFTVDLVERARNGHIDPIVGRDEEVRQIIDILMRRRQNNPVLVGEAGVGKTAVVEGFAHRIVAGDVPTRFKDHSLRALDIGLLQAGAGVKGEFEQRLRSVIDEVQNAPQPTILFIDEVHTLIGAGGSAGTGDAANLLKPALARGLLKTIAATTWDEFRKHIEKDPALSRRFQQVFVAEPEESKAVRMLRTSCSHLEKHHQVQILDEAIDAAVRLSVRFIPGRQLPDKAVSLLDTASARVAISQEAVPARLEDSKRRIEAIEVELDLLRRESRLGTDHLERISGLEKALQDARAQFAELEKHFNHEKELVSQIIAIRKKLRSNGSPIQTPADGDKAAEAADSGALLEQLKGLQGKLADFQGESPMLFSSVDQSSIAAVVSEWTGIPVGRMAKRNIEEVMRLADVLEQRVIGQRHALDMIARRIRTSRARLENPERPIAVFMFVGPSGTGKTETALALAEALYGGEQNLITINMAEFQERHTVSTLKGAPPGYVGYGEGGILTEAVRRRPYSVVLLDEVEKAHPDVHKMFFQVFDKGAMEDSEGRSINFRNAVIILTSNAAQDVIVNMCKDPELKPDPEALESALRIPLMKVFPDALLNRLAVVPYYPITKEILQRIIKLNLAKVERRVLENHHVPFTYTDQVVDLIAQRCGELERGARMVEALVTSTILPEISGEFLARVIAGNSLKRVNVDAKGESFAFEFD